MKKLLFILVILLSSQAFAYDLNGIRIGMSASDAEGIVRQTYLEEVHVTQGQPKRSIMALSDTLGGIMVVVTNSRVTGINLRDAPWKKQFDEVVRVYGASSYKCLIEGRKTYLWDFSQGEVLMAGIEDGNTRGEFALAFTDNGRSLPAVTNVLNCRTPILGKSEARPNLRRNLRRNSEQAEEFIQVWMQNLRAQVQIGDVPSADIHPDNPALSAISLSNQLMENFGYPEAPGGGPAYVPAGGDTSRGAIEIQTGYARDTDYFVVGESKYGGMLPLRWKVSWTTPRRSVRPSRR